MSSGTDMDWIASKGAPLHGELAVPGDKSVSHRAIMLASLADGVSRIDGFLEGEDARATEAIFRSMGVRIETPEAGSRIVHGVGMDGLRAPQGPLDCGNAGTGMRLLAGLLAGQAFDTELVGDASLSKRPMRRVTVPLARMGARIDTGEGGVPPLRIHGGQRLHGIDIETEVASAQVKSALLLAGLPPLSGFIGKFAIMTGVVRGAFSDLFKLFGARADEKGGLEAFPGSVALEVAELLAEAKAWRTSVFGAVDDMWDRAQRARLAEGEPVDGFDVRLASKFAARRGPALASAVALLAGGRSLIEAPDLQRRLRDAHAIASHVQYSTLATTSLGLETVRRFTV